MRERQFLTFKSYTEVSSAASDKVHGRLVVEPGIGTFLGCLCQTHELIQLQHLFTNRFNGRTSVHEERWSGKTCLNLFFRRVWNGVTSRL